MLQADNSIKMQRNPLHRLLGCFSDSPPPNGFGVTGVTGRVAAQTWFDPSNRSPGAKVSGRLVHVSFGR